MTAIHDATNVLTNPFNLLRVNWPNIRIPDYQGDIIESVAVGNKLTIVPAGNMLGKDFITAFIVIWFFGSRVPCRIVTSSVDQSQLEGVLWGEMRNWVDSSKHDLGLRMTQLKMQQIRGDGTVHPLSECIGRVAQAGRGEGLLGRHVPKGSYRSWINEDLEKFLKTRIPRGAGGESRSLGVIDEASGFEDIHKDAMETWAHQLLVIGNCYDTANFFKTESEAGDQLDPTDKTGVRYDCRVIRITAMQSPNVALGLAEEAAGLEASYTQVIPGCMSYAEYLFRRTNWSIKKQTIGLDARFYEGEEIRLYPSDWLDLSIAHALVVAEKFRVSKRARTGKALGVDPAEGGDDTVWTVVDDFGVLYQHSQKTNDTSTIYQTTIDIGEQWGVPSSEWVFDAGGGKVHVDLLNRKGYKATAVAFGSSPTKPEKRIDPRTGVRITEDAPANVYKNRRAQMFGELREELNPRSVTMESRRINGKTVEVPVTKDQAVFAIPSQYKDLLLQMAPIPLTTDAEGRLYVLPKGKPNPTYKGMTLEKLLGRSPDQLDSLVLANHRRRHPVQSARPRFI